MKRRVKALGAVAVLGPLLAGCGNSAMQRGDEALNRQDFDTAISTYLNVLSQEPDNVAVRYRLVDAHVKRINVSRSRGPVPLPELETTVQQVHEIITPVQATEPELRRALIQLHLSLARNYDEAGMPEQARDEWRVIATLQPTSEAQFNIGHASMLLGDWEGAIGAFQEAVALDAFLAEAYKGLGNALIQVRKDSEAVEAYQKALEIEPLDSSTRYNLGVALHRTGRLEEAIGEFQVVIEQDPAYSLPYRGMRNALEKQGDFEAAVEWDRRWREVSGIEIPEDAAAPAQDPASPAASQPAPSEVETS